MSNQGPEAQALADAATFAVEQAILMAANQHAANQQDDALSDPEEGEEDDEGPPEEAAQDVQGAPLRGVDVEELVNPFVINGGFTVPQDLPDIYLMVSWYNHVQLVHLGYIFSCNNPNKTLSTHHWRCVTPGCRARVNTLGFSDLRGPPTHPHNHEVPTRHLLNIAFRWYLRRVVRQHIDTPNRVLVAEGFRQVPAVARGLMSSPAAFCRYLSRLKTRLFGTVGQAQLLQSLRIDLHDQFLEDGEYFFLGDNFQEGGPRVIGFATQRNLETLNNASTWMVDGTFSSCPRLFGQVWVIHGLVGEVFLPLVFFLLEGQDQGSYVTALQMVKGGIDQFEAPDQRRWARGPGC